MPAKLFASAAEVDAALAKAKAAHKGDNTNTAEVLVSVGPYPVQLEYRTGTTAPSVHKGRAELIYVMDGGCTLVTGGKLVNAKEGAGGNMSGTAIEGGIAPQGGQGRLHPGAARHAALVHRGAGPVCEHHAPHADEGGAVRITPALTNWSITRFSPALSKSTVSLLPSTASTRP